MRCLLSCFVLTLMFRFLPAQTNPQWHLFHPPLILGACVPLQNDIWLNTHRLGIIRMDKLNGQWQHYHSGNAPFASNSFSDLEVDAQKRLWAAYQAGGFMVWENNTWKSVSSGTTEILNLRRDYAGNLWFEGNGGVYSIENGLIRQCSADFESKLPLTAANSTGSTDYWYASKDTLKRQRDGATTLFPIPPAFDTFLFAGDVYTLHWVHPVYVFADGRILLELRFKTRGNNNYSQAYQQVLFDGQNWELPPALNPKWSKRNGLRSITMPDNALYVQHNDLILSVSPDGFQTVAQSNCMPSVHYVNAYTKDEAGYFWGSINHLQGTDLRTGPSRLIRFKTGECQAFPAFSNTNLTNYSSHRLAAATDGAVWVVPLGIYPYYYYEGMLDISVFKTGHWKTIPIEPFNATQKVNIVDFKLGQQAKPYVLTRSSDLNHQYFWHWDGLQFEPSSHPVMSFALEPGSETLWYISNTRLYRVVDGGAAVLMGDPQTTPGMPLNSPLDQLVVDDTGNLWATVDNSFPEHGLYRRTPNGNWQKWDESNSPLSKTDFSAPKLFYDRQGHIWLLGSNSLWRFDGVQFEPRSNFLQGPNRILELAVTPDSILWAASFAGLTKIEKDQAQSIPVLNAADQIAVFHIAVDTAGNVWMSTSVGIAVYNPKGIRLPGITTTTAVPDPTPALRIFPNPFNVQVEVQFPQSGDFQAQLFDQLGRLCATAKTKNSNTLHFFTDFLPKGVYFIHIEGQRRSYKLVKI